MEVIFNMNDRHIVCKIFKDLSPPDFAQCLAVCRKWNTTLSEEVALNTGFRAKRSAIEEEWIWMKRAFPHVTPLPKYEHQVSGPVRVDQNLAYVTGENVAMFWDVDALLRDDNYHPKTLSVSPRSQCLGATQNLKIFWDNPHGLDSMAWTPGPKLHFYDDNGLAYSNFATASIGETPRQITQETLGVLAVMFDKNDVYIIPRPMQRPDKVELLKVARGRDGSIAFNPVCTLPLTGQEFPYSPCVFFNSRSMRAICGDKFAFFPYHPYFKYYEESGSDPCVLIYDFVGEHLIMREEVVKTREGKSLDSVESGSMNETFFAFATRYGKGPTANEVLRVHMAETGKFLGEYDGVRCNYGFRYTLGVQGIAYLASSGPLKEMCHVLTLTRNGDLEETHRIIDCRNNLLCLGLLGRTGRFLASSIRGMVTVQDMEAEGKPRRVLYNDSEDPCNSFLRFHALGNGSRVLITNEGSPRGRPLACVVSK